MNILVRVALTSVIQNEPVELGCMAGKACLVVVVVVVSATASATVLATTTMSIPSRTAAPASTWYHIGLGLDASSFCSRHHRGHACEGDMVVDEGLNVGDDSGSEEPKECWFHVSFTAVGLPLLICVECRQSYSFQWVPRATLDLK